MKTCISCNIKTDKALPKGNILIEIILWLWILPGLIYSIWSRSGSTKCPHCLNNTLVPGAEYIDEHPDPDGKDSQIKVVQVLIAIFLFFILKEMI